MLWSMPQTLLAQLIFFILVVSGWFRSWTLLIRPIPHVPLWILILLQIAASFFIWPISPHGTLYVGGLLLPLLLVLFFSHHWRGWWYPLSATLLLTSVLLFVREFIRYNPVFWVMDEAWGISIIALILAFTLGRSPGESWLFLTIGVALTEAGFLMLHAKQYAQLNIADPWFQGLCWRVLWLGAVATAIWQFVPSLAKNSFIARWSSSTYMRKPVTRK